MRALAGLVAALALGIALLLLRSRDEPRGAHAPAATTAPASEPPRPTRALASAPAPAEEALEPPAESRRPAAPEPAPDDGRFAPDELAADEGVLQVRVVAIEDGRPLAGVAVRLEEEDGTALAGPRGADARTDGRGRAELAAPAGRALFVHANRGLVGGMSVRKPVAALEPAQIRTVPIEVVAAPELVWHGRVVDAATMAPLPRALVRCATGSPRRVRFEVEAGTDGRVELALSAKAAALEAECDGFAPRSFVAEPGHERPEVEELVPLLRWAELAVVVRDAEGNPQRELEVLVSGPAVPRADDGATWTPFSQRSEPARSAWTDAAGHCSIGGLLPERELDLVVRQATRPLHRRNVGALASGERRAVAVEVGPPAELCGTLRGPDGAPVAGATLELWAHVEGARVPRAGPGNALDAFRRERRVATTTCDARGRFCFGDVPAGEWELAFPPDGGAWAGHSDPDGLVLVEPRVALRSGERRELALAAARGLSIAGSVRGDPLGAYVTARSAECEAVVVPGEDGSFRVGPLRPGTYAVSARSRHGESDAVEAEAGASGVELVLPGGESGE